jgi:hypothetical protein
MVHVITNKIFHQPKTIKNQTLNNKNFLLLYRLPQLQHHGILQKSEYKGCKQENSSTSGKDQGCLYKIINNTATKQLLINKHKIKTIRDNNTKQLHNI